MKNKQIFEAFKAEIIPLESSMTITGGNEGHSTNTAGSTIAFHTQILGFDITFGYTEDDDADGDWVSDC